MHKKVFLIFAVVIVLVSAALIGFIQSAQFASMFKRAVAKHLPSDFGVDGDFSEFAINLYPPSLSVKGPKIVLRERNVVGLPAGSSIDAARIDFVFRPFQMFSKNIWVHKVQVVGGSVVLDFDDKFLKKKPTPKNHKFKWDELLEIHAEAVSFIDSKLHVKISEPNIETMIDASVINVEQYHEDDDNGLAIELALDFLKNPLPKEWGLPDNYRNVRLVAKANASGLSVESVSLFTNGLRLSGNGNVRGNLLTGKNLIVDGSVIAAGELKNFYHVFKRNEQFDENAISGSVLFDGKVKGGLENAIESIKAEGLVKIQGARFQKWGADSVLAEGSWSASPDGGEISIKKLLVSAKESRRDEGMHIGWGGKVSAGPFVFRIAKLREGAALNVPLMLDRAHLHWLAAPGAADVYPLSFRATGKADLSIQFSEEWKVSSSCDLKIIDFQLDNQSLGKVKKLHKILHIPQLTLLGKLDVDRSGVHPQNMLLSMAKSKFIASGSVDFKKGYNLFAEGTSDLEDVGQIAENDIKGLGHVSARVHGPASRVIIDFDADIKNGYYLNLKLGDIKGQITWDNGSQQLIFNNVEGAKKRTEYVVDGAVDVSASSSIHLNVGIPRGTVNDLIDVFAVLTKDLWWFPRSLDGNVVGNVKITGDVDLNKLVVLAKLKGTSWSYFGERFRFVSLMGGYDKGRYHIESLRTVKHFGEIIGKISYDLERKFNWLFRTENFTVRDVDHISYLGIPIRGNINLLSEGRGKLGAIESNTSASVSEVIIRGQAMSESSATLQTREGVANFIGKAFGNQGNVSLSYSAKAKSDNALSMRASGLDFSSLLLVLNPKLIQDKELSGRVSGRFDLKFKTDEFELGSGEMELTDYRLSKLGSSFSLEKPVFFKIEKGSFTSPAISVQGSGGTATLLLKAKAPLLEGTINGTLDASIIEFLTPTVEKAKGSIGLDFTIGGAVKAPKLVGNCSIQNANLQVAAVESPFENVNGTLVLRQNAITIQKLDGDLANGRVHATGNIHLFADRYPQLNLTGTLMDNRLRIYPFQFVKVKGKVNIFGSAVPYSVDGDVFVESALSKEKILGANQGRMLRTAKYTPLSTKADESDYPKFKLNINVKADKNIIVQNDLFDAELKANVTLVNTIEAPRLMGETEMIHGKLVFKDRQFNIQSAKAVFDNPTALNPKFNLTAQTDVNNVKVQVYAAGDISKYKIDLSSNPTMPEADILSLLTLGLTSDEIKKINTGDRANVEQGEAASLVLHSLDFNRDIRDKTGLQIDIDESVNTQSGSNIFRKRSENDASAAPKIVIKRQIGKKVDLSLGSTVGVGTNRQQEVNAELHVTPNFSVIGVWDKQEGINSSSSTTESSYGSYGVDLKLHKRFK